MNTSSAYGSLKQAIIELKNYDGAEHEDDVCYAANKLNTVLRALDDHAHTWNRDAIRDFVLKQHDPLKYIRVQSQAFHQYVRSIQHTMILSFS